MSRQNFSKHKLLLLILALAAFLRFYKLDSFPVAVSWDEAAIGYNAFSVASTARDEYGTKLPLLFRSFDDFKLPGYIYLDALLVKFFGLSTYTLRAPSALLGTVSVLAIFLIVRFLFDQKIALIAAFFLAISPWHLQFSRAAFESNASMAVILVGVVLLFEGVKKRVAAVISTPILCLSLYFYYSPRIFVPVILAGFFIIYKSELKKNLKYYLTGLVIALLISLPITYKTFSNEGQKRVKEVSIFADISLAKDYVNARYVSQDLIGGIFLNQRVPYILETLKGYSSHFSPTFLFFAQDPNPRHRAAAHGNMYIFEAITVLFGSIVLIKKNFSNKNFLLVWLLAAPIAAAPSADSPHSLRALLMLPPLIIISSIGASELIKK